MKSISPFLFSALLLILTSSFECTQKESVQPNEAIKITAYAPTNPVLRDLPANPFLRLVVIIPEGTPEKKFRKIHATINAAAVSDIQKLELFLSGSEGFSGNNAIASVSPVSGAFEIPVEMNLQPGVHFIWLSVVLKSNASLDPPVEIHLTRLADEQGKNHPVTEDQSSYRKRQGVAIRKAGDEGVNTYRIPGLIATDKGTLIAVYDIRYNNSRDLPENIDVGMNRSTDGGKTWEPMKIIMDMGEPHATNGIGDPAILFDPVTKKIWVAALWSKGNRSIAGSGPGLTPDETGQFVLTSSEDDGLTWTAPFSITPQVKDPAWKIFFQGPGNGIAMENGTIVFPAQFWDAKGMPHSTLIYSSDHGKTWKPGTGAKSNTTESQLVETTPGTLMLNMRDNRGSFRSVATTTDMGATWKEHPTSYSALPDPVCMGSLLKAKVKVNGSLKEVLFFSNQDKSAAPREKITIKASLDLGETWMPAHQLLIDERSCYGYSSLTQIDENTLALFYEGIKDLYFVKIPVKDIIK